ncbi:MAG: glycosyltransferase family 39 protein, partial [Burkholderiaceae bacterium]
MEPVLSNAGASGAIASIASARHEAVRQMPAGREWRVALCLGVGFLLLWGVATALAYQAPDIDSAEQFVWAVSLEGGYYKHPPLPTWIMHGLIALFGPSLVLPVVAAQACIATALALTWRLGCEFMSPLRSGAATLLTSLVTYYNIGGDSFNHNTVLLPFQAATLLLFYLATRRGGSLLLWILTGLLAGLSVLVKYVALAPLAGMALYFVLDRSLHRREVLLGALLASAVFVLVLLPHAWWLVSVDFLPIRYAQFVTHKLPETLAPLPKVADFVFTQLQRMIPFLIALAVLATTLRVRRAGALKSGMPAAQPAERLSADDRLFVWIAALAPLLIVLAVGLFGGTALAARWGTNAFLLCGHVALLAVAMLRGTDAHRLWRITLWIVLPLQLLLCVGQTIGKTIGADWLGIPTRPNYPGALLARMAESTWREHAGPNAGPLRLIASDSWLGGNLILHAHGQPRQVLIDGSHRHTPWVAPDAAANCGMLVLEDITGNRHTPSQPHPELDALMAATDVGGVWTLAWSGKQRKEPTGPRAIIRWGIIARTATGASCPIGKEAG